jgi:16S rRNA processing protein RimM
MADVFSFPTDRYILIGKVGKPQGLHGEVRLYPSYGQPERIRSYSRLVLVSSQGRLSPAFQVTTCRIQGKAAIVGFESITDRSQAEQLKGMGALLDKSDLPEESEDASWDRFLGVPVKTEEGRELGRAETIFSNGAQNILVVQGSGREYLIPIVDSIIVRRTDEEIIVAPPPGLLEINSGMADEGND